MAAPTPPTPLAARWGLGLELAGGLVLQVAPFLAFASVPVLALRVPVPGVLLHGGVLLVCGFLAVLLAALRRPWPGAQLVLAALASGFLAWDVRLVLERTEYVLGRVQLSLVGVNSFLAKVGADPVDLMPRGTEGWDYLGTGLWLSGLGILLLVAGALLEAAGQASTGKRLPSVLLSLPRCGSCNHRVDFGMAFCPGCGRSQGRGRACPSCGGWLQEGFRYCPGCGSAGPS